MLKRGVLFLGFILLFAVAVNGQFMNTDYFVTGAAVVLPDEVFNAPAITGAQSVGRTVERGQPTQTGPTQERKKPCRTAHIHAAQAKLSANVVRMQKLQANLNVQIANFNAQVQKLNIINNQLNGMIQNCVGCGTKFLGNVTLRDLNLTNATAKCTNCTKVFLHQNLLKIKLQLIQIKAQMIKIQAEIKGIRLQMIDIQAEFKAIHADLFACKFDCPECPPGYQEVPIPPPTGIFCAGGKVDAIIGELRLQIAEIDAFLAKIDIEFKQIDIIVDTLEIEIKTLLRIEQSCVDCLIEGDVVISGKSQMDLAKELGLLDNEQWEKGSSRRVGNKFHTTFKQDDTSITVETSKSIGGTTPVRLAVTGGNEASINLRVHHPARGFLSFLGFGSFDETFRARIVRAEVSGEVIHEEEGAKELTPQQKAQLQACGNCTVKTLANVAVQVKMKHQHITARALKIKASVATAHAKAVRATGKIRTISAAFLKCVARCPRCIRLTDTPRDDAITTGTQPRDEIVTTSPQQQDAISTPQTTTKSCSELCGERGMTTDRQDFSSHILSILNSKGVCKKNAQISGQQTLRISIGSQTCMCYPKSPPSVSVSGDISCNSPCGPVECNGQAQCPCPDTPNCVLTVRCNWGGWRRVGETSYQPVIQTSS